MDGVAYAADWLLSDALDYGEAWQGQPRRVRLRCRATGSGVVVQTCVVGVSNTGAVNVIGSAPPVQS